MILYFSSVDGVVFSILYTREYTECPLAENLAHWETGEENKGAFTARCNVPGGKAYIWKSFNDNATKLAQNLYHTLVSMLY